MENVFDCARDDTTCGIEVIVSKTFHCVSFTCSSLTVCEDCGVVTLEYTFNGRECGYLVDLVLRCVHVENSVESKTVVLEVVRTFHPFTLTL